MPRQSTSKTSGKTLDDLFKDELADMYDAENRLVKALPKMAKIATDSSLQEAINNHLEETQGHVAKLEDVFRMIGKEPKGKKCDAMVGLLEEGNTIGTEFKNSPAINAAIISAAQKVEHYEIASYGCLSEWAGLMGNTDAQELFEEILAEEKACDETLTELARTCSNEEALEDEETEEDEDSEEEDDMPKRGGRSTGMAARPKSKR